MSLRFIFLTNALNCIYKTIINMKLKLYTAAALIGITALASCAGNDNNSYVDKSIMPTAEEKAASEKAAAEKAAVNTVTPVTNAMPANLQQVPQQVAQQPGSTIIMPGGKTVTVPGGGPISITPANAVPQNNMVMTPVQTPVPTVTQPGMNPPHGQPNHRCDIAVGAPLNSKPAPTQATTVNAQPQVTMTEVPNKIKTAPGMNPPHGEPNHRCDIAVGAPLNSKPAPAPTTVTTAPPALLAAPKTDSTKN
jgi:hypothetical protein